jgi:type I restriction enzyme M protein
MSNLMTQAKRDVDKLWTEFWTGGITNPLTVIEQISYLMFARLLDVMETTGERRAARTKRAFHGRFDGPDDQRRWKNFRQKQAEQMLAIVRDEVFPHIRALNGGTTFSEYMKDAQFMIQKPSLLVSAVTLIDKLPLIDGDGKGDLYEYLLGKLTTAGINGQFRTPRHIIRFMVELLEPKPTEIVGDPACGTAGFLVGVMQYLLKTYTSARGKLKGEDGEIILTGDLLEPYRAHIQNGMFHGFDFDATMLRIASMNLMLHGVDNPGIHYQDTLSNSFPERFPEQAVGGFDVVLANPPFKGSLDAGDVHPTLAQVVKTKKTELLFVALILRMLKKGGRSAAIVPAGVLEAESSAHAALRKSLVEDNQLEAVFFLPHWVFRPYASVATAVVVFTKGGRTKNVLFYRVENDGFNDDAAKTASKEDDLPDALAIWRARDSRTYQPRPGKHRIVSREELVASEHDLSLGVNLRQYEYPAEVPLVRLDAMFDIRKGTVGAATVNGGRYPFMTSAEEPKRHDEWTFDCEAICIPLVSSTGHGHASLKTIHYVSGRFAAATITAVLIKKPDVKVHLPYVYNFLLAHKEELLVPLMRGAANVSLSLERLGRVRVPVPAEPDSLGKQKGLVVNLDSARANLMAAEKQLERARGDLVKELERFRNQL